MDALIDIPNLERVLEEFAREFYAEYRASLIYNDREASGELLRSVSTQVVVGETSYEVTVSLADYWKYVEEDTPPHWPPRDAILKWVKVKPSLPRPFMLNGREISPESLTFLIRRAIAGQSPNQASLKNPHGGTTGTHDLAETRDLLIGRYRKRIAEALGRDFQWYNAKALAGD